MAQEGSPTGGEQGRFAAARESVNTSCQPGSFRLDEFIASEFRAAADLGDIIVMVRR